MALQQIWNDKYERWEWVDLSYVLGKTKQPDPRHGQPVDQEQPKAKKTKKEVCANAKTNT